MSFASPSLTFPRFSKLLDKEEYRYNILLGMTVSVGGLTESLVSISTKRRLKASIYHVNKSSFGVNLDELSDAIT